MTRVLIIDDDKDTVEVLSEFLSLYDIDVVAKGHNGRDAVALYQEFKPDFVLMDVMMPEYDGFYGLSSIRTVDPTAKVIMITADLTTETEIKLQELKANAIIYKPFDMDKIINLIRNTSYLETITR